MAQYLLIALATFGSEDLTCIATGALIASRRVDFLPGVLACVAGIYFGDLLLYFAGRWIGRPIARWRPLRRLLTEEKLDRASEFLARRGAGVIIASRFTPGLRLPTYVAAGLLKTRFWSFAAYFLVAALLWTPALVGASALLGESLPHPVLLGPVFLLVGLPARKLSYWQLRRRALGWLRRRSRWEFWPPWAAYLPLIPYILYLGIRRRCVTLFTAANPGIPSGGFVGESKSAILAHLPAVPEFTVLRADSPVETRVRAAGALSYPVVLKPDVGERGSGVFIARSEEEIRRYVRAADRDIIAQRYVSGLEFGIFYYRYPGETRGRLLSITEKRFPFVAGDGSCSIAELILKDERAVCLADLYVRQLRRSADEVPARGETVRLAELGSHCRGAIFLNGAHLETEALCAAVDRVAQAHPGFYFGRFDVRTPSVEDLKNGRFEVLELNGVSAEATHVYDPAVSLSEAYRALFRQWRIAFEIGAMNRAAGAAPMTLGEFARLVLGRISNPA